MPYWPVLVVHMIDTSVGKGQLVDPWQAKITWGLKDDVCWLWGTAAGACNWPCARDKIGGVLWQPDNSGGLIMSQGLLCLWIFCHG